jgi:hypothetical protein
VKTLLALIVVLLASNVAQGQTLIQADIASAQPVIGRDNNGFSHCGFRAVVGIVQGKSIEMFDFSVQVYSTFEAIMKAGKYRGEISDQDIKKLQRRTVTPGPRSFWIGAADSPKVATNLKTVPSEDKGFSLFSTEFQSAAEAAVSLIGGKRLQFSVRYPDEKFDHVVAFSANLTQDEKDDFWACMQGIQSRMEADLQSRTADK